MLSGGHPTCPLITCAALPLPLPPCCSFGVVLWELCTGGVPVRGRMRPLQAPQDCPQEVVDLAADCMEADPQARPTAQQLVQRLLAVPGPSPGKQQEQQLPREKAQREQREQQRQQAASWGATPRPPRPARQPFTAPAGTPVVLVAQGGELRRRHSYSLPLPDCPDAAAGSAAIGAELALPDALGPGLPPKPASGSAVLSPSRPVFSPPPHAVHVDLYGLGMF